MQMGRRLIIFGILMILLVGIVSSQLATETEKPALTKDLEQKAIEKENKTKLIDTYGKTFTKVKSFNSYKQKGNITIINVTIKEGKIESYARIITNTQKFKEVLTWQ